MPTTTRSDLVIPEVLADAVAGAWPNRIALYGTDAVVESRTLPGGVRRGDRVKVPYFGVIGELEEPAENAALTPVAISMTAEEATVRRAGRLVEITSFAQMAAMYADPYAEISRQLVEAARRKFDEALISVASAASGDGVATEDAGTATISYDAIANALGRFGDAQVDVAALVVHSKVLTDLRKVKSADGHPIFQNAQAGGLPQVLGLPIVVSDRVPVISGNPPKYVSLFVRRGALALWYNGVPVVETDRDIARDTVLFALNIYFVAHRYSRLPGSAAPTVVRLVTQ